MIHSDNCQCCACGELFTTGFSFEKHRVILRSVKSFRCRTIEEMISAGMKRTKNGAWKSHLSPAYVTAQDFVMPPLRMPGPP